MITALFVIVIIVASIQVTRIWWVKNTPKSISNIIADIFALGMMTIAACIFGILIVNNLI